MRSLALGPACLGLGVSVTGARTLVAMFLSPILRLQLLKTQKGYSCLQNANRKLNPSTLFLFPSTFTHTHTHTHARIHRDKEGSVKFYLSKIIHHTTDTISIILNIVNLYNILKYTLKLYFTNVHTSLFFYKIISYEVE